MRNMLYRVNDNSYSLPELFQLSVISVQIIIDLAVRREHSIREIMVNRGIHPCVEAALNITFDDFSDIYKTDVIDIFNYYIENSFAAYPETPVSYEAFYMMQQLCKGYPAFTACDRDSGYRCIGFAFLKPYNMMTSFRTAAEINYFIHPGYTGKGIGNGLLRAIETAAIDMGITSILAGISSRNTGSIRFHENNGFERCGVFRGIGMKKGNVFDVIWMQKQLL